MCGDPHRAWYPQRTICYSSMVRESAQRRYEELHKARPYHNGTFEHWSEKPDRDHPFHYSEGVTIWASEHDLTPDDDFLDDATEVTPESLARFAD